MGCCQVWGNKRKLLLQVAGFHNINASFCSTTSPVSSMAPELGCAGLQGKLNKLNQAVISLNPASPSGGLQVGRGNWWPQERAALAVEPLEMAQAAQALKDFVPEVTSSLLRHTAPCRTLPLRLRSCWQGACSTKRTPWRGEGDKH